MLNENKIKLMTKTAIYENKEGKEALRITTFFRSDYLSLQLLKSFISVTVAYVIGIAIYVVCKMDYYLENMQVPSLLGTAKNFAYIYAVILIVYMIVTYGIYYKRYQNARKSIKHYYTALKRINSLHGDDKLNS